MSDLFRIAAGLEIDGGASLLTGIGVPGGDSAEQDAASIGSIYKRTDTSIGFAQIYIKVSDTNSTSDWVQNASKQYVDSVIVPDNARIYYPRTLPIPDGWYNHGDAEFGDLVAITNVPSDETILRVKTDNTGVSSSTQMLLPARLWQIYDFTIDWGDGTVEDLVNADATTVGGIDGFLHTYSSAGIYTIRISGVYEELIFIFQGDEKKVIEVMNWGANVWDRLEFAFSGCSNAYFTFGDTPNIGTGSNTIDQIFSQCSFFNADVGGWTSLRGDAHFVFSNCQLFEGRGLETWDVSGIIDMRSIFNSCFKLDADLSGWDVSNVVDMDSAFRSCYLFNADISGWTTTSLTNCEDMFHDAVSFDQSLGDWDISNVTNMIDMLDDCGMSTANYDATLIGWASQTVQPNVVLGAKNLTYSSAAQSARDTLTGSPNNWTINEDSLV